MTPSKNTVKIEVPELPGSNRVFIGRIEGFGIMNLSKPSFDCGWYWGFGYIGNSRTHMHLSGVLNETGKDWFSAFKSVFVDSPPALQDEKNLWNFVETMKSLYTLRAAADLYYIGGSHLSSPVVSLQNIDMYRTIVEKQMPALFREVSAILEPGENQ